MRTAQADLDAIAGKVQEYSSFDLTIMGLVLEEWLGLKKGTGKEAACLFYQLGKLARALGALKDGGEASADTLHDDVIYGMMARRIREAGAWPG